MNLLTQSLGEGICSEEDRRKLLELLAKSPLLAWEWADSLQPWERKAALRLLLAMEWAEIDFAAAWQWAGKQSEDAMTVAVLFSHARNGGDIIGRAGDWLVIGGERADMRAGALVGILADSSQWNVLEPLIKLCPDHQQERLLNSCIYTLAASDPAAALEMANRVEDDQIRQEQLRSVLDGWSRDQLPELADYALSQTDSAARTTALDFFAYNMLTSGRGEELKSWIDLHPEHAGIDTQGMALLAQTIPGTEHAFEFALRGIGKIPDDVTRTRLYSEVIVQLSAINPHEAARMVEATGLIDQSSKSRLLGTIRANQH